MKTDDVQDDPYAKQTRYKNGLEVKGLRDVRVVVPIRAIESLRDWAKKERELLKEESRDG